MSAAVTASLYPLLSG